MVKADQHIRISVLGDAWSYHHLAAISKFGEHNHFMFWDQFAEMISDVVTGNSDLCIIAVENSLAGDVSNNYTKVVQSGLYIQDEIKLRVHLQFGVLPGVELEDVETVYTHPMAWKESSRFFSNYPAIQLMPTASTASGAKLIAEQQLTNAAAITNLTALNHYQLQVIRNDIDDHPDNFTRFLVLSQKTSIPETTNKNLKASLLLQFPDNEEGKAVDSLSDQFRILVVKQISKGESYIEAEIKDSSQFDHLQETIHHKLWAIRICGIFEQNDITEGL